MRRFVRPKNPRRKQAGENTFYYLSGSFRYRAVLETGLFLEKFLKDLWWTITAANTINDLPDSIIFVDSKGFVKRRHISLNLKG